MKSNARGKTAASQSLLVVFELPKDQKISFLKNFNRIICMLLSPFTTYVVPISAQIASSVSVF